MRTLLSPCAAVDKLGPFGDFEIVNSRRISAGGLSFSTVQVPPVAGSHKYIEIRSEVGRIPVNSEI